MLILGASTLTTVLTITFVAICVILVLIVLIQKPKGGGLAGAFGGGGGGGQGVFGAKVGDALTWITVTIVVGFFGLAIALVFLTRSESDQSTIITDTSIEATETPDTDTLPDTGTTPQTDTPNTEGEN